MSTLVSAPHATRPLPPVSRRSLLGMSVAAAAAALAMSRWPASAFGFAAGAGADADAEVIPFLEPQPLDPKRPMVHWQDLTDGQWLTPDEKLFNVSHYGMQKVDAAGWKLEVGGLVDKPLSLSLDELKARPKRDVTATLECSGNGAAPGFMGAIGNAVWGGTPLAPLLAECGVKAEAVEVQFWGADRGKEKIRDNEYEQNFARALSLDNATKENVLLAWEMNGKPLTEGHGFPLRLVVPGWYGIAWVKWLQRIEASDRRLMTRFMARDYVTIRGEEKPDGSVVWRETSVGPMNVKSLVARVARRKADGSVLVSGAAWTDGTPLKSVELQIDGGPWLAAKVDEAHREPFTWRFWSYEWKDAAAGEHTLVSRATDEKGRVQPSADDPAIRLKKTYWEANAQLPRKVKL